MVPEQKFLIDTIINIYFLYVERTSIAKIADSFVYDVCSKHCISPDNDVSLSENVAFKPQKLCYIMENV